MEQTGTNQCLVFVGSMETHVADRMEDYARQNDMNVVDTVFKDDKAIDKLTYYIEREGVICILVRSIWDISTDRETVKSIMKLAAEHNVSINEENRGFEPATLSIVFGHRAASAKERHHMGITELQMVQESF